jgi:pyruvate formate lyase activating enzyme
VTLSEYGRVSSVAVDPIEKKPLYHFLPGSRSLSLGTIGCNLICRFCQNWHISKPNDDSALDEERLAPERIAEAAVRARCASVSYTYNEPIIGFEFTLDCADACRERGVANVAVTNGYIEPEPRAEFFTAMDAANVDLKSFNERWYRRICGAHLQPVLDTLVYIHTHTPCWLEVTTLLIPGENDRAEELTRLVDWVLANLGPEVPLHFTAFHPNYRMLDHESTPPEILQRARRLAMDAGVRYVYTGNIWDAEGATTWCSGCGAALVRRQGFAVTELRLGADGRCPQCGQVCPGVWERPRVSP